MTRYTIHSIKPNQIKKLTSYICVVLHNLNKNINNNVEITPYMFRGYKEEELSNIQKEQKQLIIRNYKNTQKTFKYIHTHVNYFLNILQSASSKELLKIMSLYVKFPIKKTNKDIFSDELYYKTTHYFFEFIDKIFTAFSYIENMINDDKSKNRRKAVLKLMQAKRAFKDMQSYGFEKIRKNALFYLKNIKKRELLAA